MHLPTAVNRFATRALVAPLLSPTLPVPVRRRGLDLVGASLPLPRGTRRARGDLGGVPTEVVAPPGPFGPHRVLYLHGGGYLVGSAASHRPLLAGLAHATGTPVHAPAYRLAPEHPFPAALDDALAAWHALRAAGHPARRIAVAGDSAGGGLTMSLLLRLRDAGEELPGAIGLISPWLDLTCTAEALTRNAAADAMLDPSWLPSAVADYAPDGADAPELCPLDADLAGLPPLHVVAGAEEVLADDADTLVARARTAGTPVTYQRTEGMWHAFPTLAGLLAEADEALRELGRGLRADCSR
ncbi:alpha/beta hydrolase [Pseudonocardia sp. C8]|uniref:alpha/beta hydrolase n=1 Tax=Pseudonocardia sp. C8 TaxID=2762759 RepID=UPI001642F4DA|nr:alpha/beta hydrolase [Pseudonocardia sp. C8]MBC3189708.1 alpha/beta hydrolase [Pseudonocardia sp. C8]